MTTETREREKEAGFIYIWLLLRGEARDTHCLLAKAATHGDVLLSQKLLPCI